MRAKFFTCLPIVFFLLVVVSPSYSQHAGCPDPHANNYDSSATVNDGSCKYDITSYSPPLKVNPISDTLIESSGLQMAGDFLWSFNDGGGAAAIYRIDTITRKVYQVVYLENAVNTDWEDIAFDGTYFYVGDFGNNENGGRTDLKIYKFALNDIPDYTSNPSATIAKEKISVISFKYSNQLIPVPSPKRDSTRFDCEAMIVDKGKIHLFSKNWIDLNTTHYVINSLAAGIYIADSVETFQTDYLVTGADKAPDQNVVVFIGYLSTFPGKHFMQILSDYTGDSYFNGNKRKLDLPDASQMGQAEGIAFKNNSYGYISNENLFFVTQKLRSFDIGKYVTLTPNVLPLDATILKAFQKTNGVQVEWQVSSDADINSYEVEKSKDGKQFIKATSLPANNNSSASSYKWVDPNPYNDNNFYRVKSIGKSGDIKYSGIINVKIGGSINNIDVYPNPVKNKSLTVRLTNQNKGIYTVRLFNNSGQLVYTKAVEHDGGSALQTLQLNAAIIRGIYQLQVSNGQTTVTRKVVCN